MTFDYACNTCGHDFAADHGMNDPRPCCPECGSKVERVFRDMRFNLPGGGWAKDGYSKSGNEQKRKDGS